MGQWSEVRSRWVGSRTTNGLESWVVHKIGRNEAVLFFDGWVVICVAAVGVLGVVIVVAPLSLPKG